MWANLRWLRQWSVRIVSVVDGGGMWDCRDEHTVVGEQREILALAVGAGNGWDLRAGGVDFGLLAE